MKYKVFSAITAAILFIVGGTSIHAEQIIVKKGDTLWGLSQQHGTTVQSIKKWNNLSDDVIHPNDVLEVSPVKTLTIRKGDTLWNISKVYGVSVDSLMKWNNLSSDVIHPGLRLVIYTDGEQSQVNQTQPAQAKQEAPKEPAKSNSVEAAAPVEPAAPTTAEAPVSEQPIGKEITVEATAYTAECKGCSGITKTGVDLKANPDKKVIAVDPSVIPLGSKVHVEGYGYATAEDIGGAINGNKIDVFVPEHEDAIQWGRKQVKVTIID
ncbi:LysM peptidoglycan-binding domain-containing protein [Niallia sp. XMNu-256]|uniref:3D domain-containing protein n=1 Tax=Niallia sp. XMNu-256 TaxID=3082444 RepID=UPI0030D10996